MARLNANPTVEASLAFDVVKPDTYDMRVETIEEFSAASGNTCWKVKLSYVDPSACTKENGEPATNPGNVFDNSLVVSPAEKQGKLRGFVEACGRAWTDLDSDELIGCDVTVKVIKEEYPQGSGNWSNKAGRYLIK